LGLTGICCTTWALLYVLLPLRFCFLLSDGMLLHRSRLQLCDILFNAETLLRCFGGELLAQLFLELLKREATAFGFFRNYACICGTC
jgi:hypothetical protein